MLISPNITTTTNYLEFLYPVKIMFSLCFSSALSTSELESQITKYDLKRLELYSRNMADYHLITDLLPTIARFFFLQRTQFSLPVTQKVSS